MSTKGYGMDTERSEIIREKKLKVKYLDIFVEESGTSNFEKFISRMRNYGKGDYEFYKNNSKSWGLKRKAKSLTHVFFRYWVVYHGSMGRTSFEVSFPLRCFQQLSRPYLATRHCSWRYNRSTSGMFNPVLSY